VVEEAQAVELQTLLAAVDQVVEVALKIEDQAPAIHLQ
jgi:hypothetical protein